MEAVERLSRHVGENLNRVVIGQDDLKRQCLIALLCRGHALVEGVPGLAKTLMVKALANVMQLAFQRVQGTPDLMPADILGTNVVNLQTSGFTLHKGPAFSQLLLVDEINRMPPRTQAALLECMEERQITIDDTRYRLSPAFTVFATQNPVDFEGTYPLPEAQLDRFLLKIRVPYPQPDEETRLLTSAHQGFDAQQLDALGLQPAPADWLEAAQAEVQQVTVQDALFGYVVAIARKTREWPSLTLGASPRASVSVLRVAKARAALEGRDYVVPDDVKAAVPPVLRHRVIVKPESDLEGVTADDVLREVLGSIEVPR